MRRSETLNYLLQLSAAFILQLSYIGEINWHFISVDLQARAVVMMSTTCLFIHYLTRDNCDMSVKYFRESNRVLASAIKLLNHPCKST